ncbi:hypothetical protein GCM10009546_53510 [Actinomadura livida]|uniref:Uncharacterized protein n=1 Tax=Actinomadura livida TaxID=79909 RepID=A0ABP3Q6S6_9ACTN|nr:hypothetical protein GCM10010208_16440 [Actinomadura livida]
MPVHQGLGAHGLVGGDVVLDDGAQDRQFPVVQHRVTSFIPCHGPPIAHRGDPGASAPALLALNTPECQVYDPDGRSGVPVPTPHGRAILPVPDGAATPKDGERRRTGASPG